MQIHDDDSLLDPWELEVDTSDMKELLDTEEWNISDIEEGDNEELIVISSSSSEEEEEEDEEDEDQYEIKAYYDSDDDIPAKHIKVVLKDIGSLGLAPWERVKVPSR